MLNDNRNNSINHLFHRWFCTWNNTHKDKKGVEKEMIADFMPRIPTIIGTIFSMLPLMIYIAYYDKKDDGHWLGIFGIKVIKLLRKLR